MACAVPKQPPCTDAARTACGKAPPEMRGQADKKNLHGIASGRSFFIYSTYFRALHPQLLLAAFSDHHPLPSAGSPASPLYAFSALFTVPLHLLLDSTLVD